MKKIYIFLTLFLLQIWQIFANLEVKTNLESGKYNFPIEINLISNDKNAKIFYYTDGVGRMDNIFEFTKPILLKSDTTIDFFATTKDFEDTPIQTVNYSFEYSDKIILILEKDKIILKNTDNEIQNIGYWKIESNNLNYEITPNTFLEKNKTFSINYTLGNNEKISLYSPDKKKKSEKIYQIPQIEEIITPSKNNQKIETISEIPEEISTLTWEESVLTWEISSQENTSIETHLLSGSQLESTENSFEVNENITASVWEKKINNKIFFFLFYLLSIIILSIISYNIYIVQSKSTKLKISAKFRKNKKI